MLITCLPLPLQNYIVSHINQQQAMVIVEHASGRYNLYLSDESGQYFSLSLPDIVTGNGVDLEVVSMGHNKQWRWFISALYHRLKV